MAHKVSNAPINSTIRTYIVSTRAYVITFSKETLYS